MSDLAFLFQEQRRLMKALGVEVTREEPTHSSNLRSAAIGVVVEGAEILDEINKGNRPWAAQPQAVTEEKMLKESIDTLFYLIELWELLGVDPEQVVTQFRAKLDINLRRVKYGKEKS